MSLRFWRRFLMVGVAAYIASSIAAIVLAELTLHPGRRVLTASDETQAHRMSTHYDAQLENTIIPASDGVTLRAWLIQPRSPFAHSQSSHPGPGSLRTSRR